MTREYIVTLENSNGDLYTHNCQGDSEREAILNSVEHMDTLTDKSYVMIDVKLETSTPIKYNKELNKVNIYIKDDDE